jgi:ribosomal protein S18 acetylase RimI-like enzyme
MEILHQAIFRSPDREPVPRSIVIHPALSRYVLGWGRAGDIGYVAEVADKPVGAAWLRLLVGDNRGYGYVDDGTPELSIALLPAYRGMGTGSRLLAHLLSKAAKQFATVSLSVTPGNSAVRLYKRLGFEIIDQVDESLTMICYLGSSSAEEATSST